ncbi:hypothetical protein DDR33_11050 [Pararcticibacter amylolyticus]|uniref:Uncharacterized protein n=1 Tax=Pararcticibacter amylolyticus TaxID=2173175 RepID=A0A2U2PGN0_9SPHI|nr:hypothetical protein DDR33_11050 [Pararcticibacter amylolyticus]
MVKQGINPKTWYLIKKLYTKHFHESLHIKKSIFLTPLNWLLSPSIPKKLFKRAPEDGCRSCLTKTTAILYLKSFWIYDGSTLSLEEQDETAGQILGYQQEISC